MDDVLDAQAKNVEQEHREGHAAVAQVSAQQVLPDSLILQIDRHKAVENGVINGEVEPAGLELNAPSDLGFAAALSLALQRFNFFCFLRGSSGMSWEPFP